MNKLANIPFELKEKEIRIYKGRGITNRGEIFRVYLDEGGKWNAELIQWFIPEKKSEDEFKLTSPKISNLKSRVSLGQAFLTLEALNIGFLPKEEFFEYKKSKKEIVFDEDEKEYVLMSHVVSVVDGADFLVKYKSNKKENEFHYYNPESYLNKYPGIDEYESFMKILKYVEHNFNIKLN